MIDGAPYTVVEFQFVKPGKGAAFTRTKMKNLLTGAVLERNLRSGDKLEPADVETKTMQYLYADADSFIFMDTTTYDQVEHPEGDRRRLGGLHAREHQRRGAVLQRPRRRRLAAELHRAAGGRGRSRASAATPRRARPSPRRSRPARASTCRCSSASATSSRSTRAPASTSSASAAPRRGRRGMVAARETLEARARILRAVRGWFEAAGVPRGRHAGARPFARAGGAPRRRAGGRRPLADHVARVPHEAAGGGGPAAHRPDREVLARRRVGAAPPRRVHDGRVVPRERAARGAGGRLRGAAARRRGWPPGAIRPRSVSRRRSRAPPCASCGRATRASTLAGDEDAAALRAKAAAAGVAFGSGDRLGRHLLPGVPRPHRAARWRRAGPTFVFDWPAPLAALARPKPGDPRVVERFELYAGRPRAGQRVRRADRCGRAAPPVRGRGAHPRRPRPAGLSDRRGAAGGAAPDAANGRDRLGVRPPGHARAGRRGTSREVVAFGDERDGSSPITLARPLSFLLCVARLEAVVTQFLNGLAQAAAPRVAAAVVCSATRCS